MGRALVLQLVQEVQVEGQARQLLMADLRKAVVSGSLGQVKKAMPLRKVKV